MRFVVYTASYKNIHSDKYDDKLVSISGDRGKSVNFEGKCNSSLAPKRTFWTVWHNNRGLVGEDYNIRYYIREYYKEVLSNLNPNRLLEENNGNIFLCYEDNDEFCHRHILAYWIELFLGVEVPEIILKENGKASILKRPEGLKEMVEEEIKKCIDMKGFNSLEALYKYKQYQNMEKQSIEIMDDEPGYSSTLMAKASDLLKESKKIEKEYNAKKLVNT